ncbi:MAG: anthranilate synthase component I [Pseudomonadales bacterium]|nr:anthranilate synthase component I [Pseudomonadales bacterium]MCP5213552.1 anthranilate synthase component I [Pseudomonadales bacterium]
MTPEYFAQLTTEGYNRIPITRTVLADLDTPLSSYLKLASGPYSYMFESVQGGEKWGRYSIIGLPCRTVIKVRGYQISVETDGELVESLEHADPFEFVKEFQARYRVAQLDDSPRYNGGLAGYFGYDTVRYIEPRLKASMPQDKIGNPDIVLMLSDEVLVFDNLAGTLSLIIHVDPAVPDAYQLAQQRLDYLVSKLPEPSPLLAEINLDVVNMAADKLPISESEFKSDFTQPEYEAAVEKIKEYALSGDIMQVVPSQRMTIPFEAEPINLYRALRNLNPSPYMFYLNLGDFYVVGASPEVLTRVENGEITVRPIAGTRRRGKTEADDLAMEQDLLSDPKEIAEHLMLIDLGRNDVGRVAKTGSVRVTDKMVVERYSHVMHIVSNVVGEIKPGLSAIDVLRATIPAGTLSGAPKIRAMEIIDEVEPVKRGVYGGAVGYISWQDNMDTCIAIRTAVIKDKMLYVQAGGGVVADSVPKLEWKETMNKARAMFRAVAMAHTETESNDNVGQG